MLCLTYDDGLLIHREKVAFDLAERGLHGTFYISVARDDLHEHPDGWREVARLGHELGNHSCWHPCRTRAEWDWKPPYKLEEYSPERVRDELLLANRVLHLIDGHSERSYGATCGDLTCGPNNESFVENIRDLFTVIRASHSLEPQQGPLPFLAPSFWCDFLRADEIISVMEAMRGRDDSWIILGMHGVGAGTHNSYMDAAEHRRLIDWISEQRSWLVAVTVLEAAANRGK